MDPNHPADPYTPHHGYYPGVSAMPDRYRYRYRHCFQGGNQDGGRGVEWVGGDQLPHHAQSNRTKQDGYSKLKHRNSNDYQKQQYPGNRNNMRYNEHGVGPGLHHQKGGIGDRYRGNSQFPSGHNPDQPDQLPRARHRNRSDLHTQYGEVKAHGYGNYSGAGQFLPHHNRIKTGQCDQSPGRDHTHKGGSRRRLGDRRKDDTPRRDNTRVPRTRLYKKLEED